MMTRKQRLKERTAKNKQRVITKHTHLGHCKGQYAKAGLFKQRLTITRENKSINCPTSRTTMATNKDSRAKYKFDTHKHSVIGKPREWIRLNHRDINGYKILTGIKYL